MNLRCLWLAAALAASALAQSVVEPVNQELPAWLRVGGDYRTRFEGTENRGFAPGVSDDYLLSRVRVNVTVKPADWLTFFFQGQDARVYFNQRIPNAPNFEAPLDLRMGYAEIGAPKGPVTLRLGRQEINFGDQRLVGSSNWANTARTFDAVRATFRSGGYRLDAFAASVVVPAAGAFDRPVTGDNLHGLVGGIEKLVPQATIEPYLFWRLQPRVTGETGVRANLDLKTVGMRWVGKLPAGFDYVTEMAVQRGSLGAEKDRAWAGHWVLGYSPARAPWKMRLISEYNFASGDENPRDGVRGTFDHLYPTPHEKYGLCDQVGWRNIHDVRGAVEVKPHKAVGAALSYHTWWLANAHDALYAAGGAVIARRSDGAFGRRVGQEIDLSGSWAINKQISLAAGVGHIFPGEFLRRATPGVGYTFPFVMLGYTF